MAAAPRTNALFFEIPGFTISPPEGEQVQEAIGVQRSSTSSSSSSAGEPYFRQPMVVAGGTTRKRRREEDHFFNARRDSVSHGREEAEAEAALEAEALALELENPWACQACTVINVAERMSCQTCGTLNARRERLRERRAKHTAQLMERSMTTQRVVMASMKDLEDLNDDDDEDDGSSEAAMMVEEEQQEEEAGGAPGVQPSEGGGGDHISSSSGSSVVAVPNYYRVRGSPIRACSSDLLLSCVSFLGDARTYTRLRGVCKAWAGVAEHEALWRPLAEALQGRLAGSGRGGEAGQRERRKSEGGEKEEEQPGKGEAAAAGPSESPAGKKPPSWMCTACGLIQADPLGLYCEFCNTQREIISSPPMAAAPAAAAEEVPSYYTKLSSHQDFAAVWGTGTNSSRAALPLWSELDRREKDKPPTAGPSSASSSSGGGKGPLSAASSSSGPGAGGRVHMAGATRDMVWEVAGRCGDWYLLVKALGTDKQLGDKWETLHRGWEWLVNAARTALRTRLVCDQEAINARNDSCVPIVESFQKVVNKLTRRDWLLTYDCVRTEFALQCEALRRDILREMRDRRVGEMGHVRGYRCFLEDLLLAWDKYQAWVYELDQHFGRLNDQVCGERYRSTTAFLPSCNFVEAHTPFLGEAALLAFRNTVMLHHAITTPLLRAIEGDCELPLSCYFGGGEGGGADEAEQRRQHEVQETTRLRRQLWEADREEEEGKLEEELVLATGRVSGGGGERSQADKQSSSSRQRRVVENLADLLERLAKVAEDMDVADDPHAPPRREQYGRLILMPLRAAVAELRVDGALRGPRPVQQAGTRGWGKRKERRGRGAAGWTDEEMLHGDDDFDDGRGMALLKGCG